MSIDKALAKTGLTLEGDSLAKENRNVKTFKRLISAIRAAEAAVQDDLSRSQVELTDSLRKNLEQKEQIHLLQTELQKLKLKEQLEGMDLTTANRQQLLEVTSE